MAKILLLIAVFAVIYLVLRTSSRRSQPPPAAHLPEEMARCSHCGVHFPRAESVGDGEHDYCSDEHRRLGVRS